jgi:hypothetical protein
MRPVDCVDCIVDRCMQDRSFVSGALSPITHLWCEQWRLSDPSYRPRPAHPLQYRWVLRRSRKEEGEPKTFSLEFSSNV